jgi:hypothetical protein
MTRLRIHLIFGKSEPVLADIRIKSAFLHRSKLLYFHDLFHFAARCYAFTKSDDGETGLVNSMYFTLLGTITPQSRYYTEAELYYKTLMSECNQKLSQCSKERHSPARKLTKWRVFLTKKTAKICFEIKR